MELIRESKAVRLPSRCGGTSSRTCRVRHRLDGYGAGTCLEYAGACDPDALAAAVVREIGRVVDDKPVETDRAARAAGLIGPLL